MILNLNELEIEVYYTICKYLDSEKKEKRYLKELNFIGQNNLVKDSWSKHLRDAIKIKKEDIKMIQELFDFNIYSERRINIDFEDDRFDSLIEDTMNLKDRIDISRICEEPKLIKDWDELKKVINSTTHKINVDRESCNGNIIPLISELYFYNYLSTHTFYGIKVKTYLESTKQLQRCGFNINIANWDGENIYPEPEDKKISLYKEEKSSINQFELKNAVDKIIEDQSKVYETRNGILQWGIKPNRRDFEVFAKGKK